MPLSSVQLCLKAAWRRIYQQLGGQEATARVCTDAGVPLGTAIIGFYGNPTHHEMPRVDAVWAAEAELGDPLLTRELVRLAGYDLFKPMGPVPPPAVTPCAAVTQMQVELGDVAAAALKAEADGRLTINEIELLLKKLADLEAVVIATKSRLNDHLARARAGGRR